LSTGIPVEAAISFSFSEPSAFLMSSVLIGRLGPGADPRLDLLAIAGLFEFGDDAINSTVLVKVTLHQRQSLGADDTA
jgi:hypothetical protein